MANQNFRVKNGLEVGVGGTILYAKDNGNVAIGTDSNLTANLTVGNIEQSSVTNKGATAFKTLASDGGVGESAIYLEEQSGSEGWYLKVNSSGDLQFNDSGASDRITFQDGGNVGIGTAIPDAKLHVNGSIRAQSDLELADIGNTVRGYVFGTSSGITYRAVGATNHIFQYNSGYNEAARIDSSGRILIGANSTQSTTGINQLQVNSFAQAHGVRPYLRAGGVGNTNWIKIYSFSYNATSSTDSGNLSNVDILVQGSTGNQWAQATLLVNRKQQGSGDNYDVQLTNTCGTFSLSGRVAYKYDAAGGTNSDGLLEVWVRPAYAYMATYVFPNSALPISGEFVCTDTGSETQPTGSTLLTSALYIDSSGRFGIGTNNPTQNLDVNGGARFRGAIYDNNNAVGAANSVLSSTGSGVQWISVSAGSDAGTLDGLDSTQFLRSDTDDQTTGQLTADTLLITNDATDTSRHRVAVYDDGNVSYGMALWNTSGTTGDWATMIYGPNQSNRRISFGKINDTTFTNHADITEIAYFDLDDSTLRLDADVYVGSNKVWHAGNHGSGSGLDADTLDGVNSGSFLRSDANDTASGVITLSGSGSDRLYLRNTTNAGEIGIRFSDASDQAQNGYIRFRHEDATSPGSAYGANFEFSTDQSNLAVIIDGSGDYFVGTNKVWHAGNDGSGSGLDADTLDGINSGSFLRSDAADIATGPISWTGTLATFDPGGSPGTDTATDVALALESGHRIAGHYTGYIRTLLEWNSSSDIEIGQGGTSLIAGINLLPGSTGVAKVNGNTIWHAGNDGSGSGLDADTLDGINSGSFLRSDADDSTSGYITFTSGISIDKINGRGTQLVLNAGESDGQISGQTAEKIYLNAEGGLVVNSSSNNWTTPYTLYTANICDTSGNSSFPGGISGTSLTASTQVNVTGSTAYGVNINTSNDGKLVLQGSNQPYIRFREGTTDKAYIQWTTSGIFQFVNQESGEYLRIASGSNGLTFNVDGTDYNVFHAGNDGSGSGLDADTVDGIQGASFLRSDAADTGTGSITLSTGTVRPLSLQTSSASPWHIELYRSDLALSSNVFAHNSPYNGWYFQHNISIAGSTNWHSGNDGSGSGLDADTLDGINSGSFLRSDADDSTSGYLQAEGFVGSGGSLRIANPGGASFATNASATTGYLKVTLPVSWTNTMMRMTIKCYEYQTGESFDIHCGGYNYAPSTSWFNTFAYITGGNSLSRDFNVRFGHDGSKCAIYIGESNSGWSYFQFGVTDFLAGYGNYSASTWHNGWSCSITTSLGTITATLSSNQLNKYVDGNTVWHAGNDGSGSGLDADLLDGQHGSYYTNASNINAGTFPDRFDSATRYNIGLIDGWSGNDYDKLRVWNSSSYTIGMYSGQTHGWLNDYAMTFTMNNETDRGWKWRDDADGVADAAMSLTTNGNLCVSNVIAVGGQTTRYLREPTGNYGSIQITGSGYSSWEGFSIDGRAVFMHDGNVTTGLYNDVDNEWLVRCIHNAQVQVYYNNSVKLETSNTGVSVTGNLTASGTVTANSDIKLKKNVKTITGALDKVCSMRGVEFDYIENDQHSIGVIAQEVEEIFPDLVVENNIIDDEGKETGETVKSVAYGNMVAVLIEAIKEQQNKINELEQRLRDK